VNKAFDSLCGKTVARSHQGLRKNPSNQLVEYLFKATDMHALLVFAVSSGSMVCNSRWLCPVVALMTLMLSMRLNPLCQTANLGLMQATAEGETEIKRRDIKDYMIYK
jgi:hypothetical protein